MKINKKMFIIVLTLAFLLILIGVYSLIATDEQREIQEEENKQLKQIVEKFNERNIKVYLDGSNVEMKAKSSSSTLTLYYLENDKYTFKLNNNILESNEVIDEETTGKFLDTLLNLKEDNPYSFFGVINNHTILDYSLENDGLEISKEESGYKLKVNLSKDLVVKEHLDVVINTKDYNLKILDLNYNGNSYYQKGFIIYKEDRDTRGNKVITFAQYKDCNIENLRQSIANYLEVNKGIEVKNKFLSEVSIEVLEQQNYTRDNYVLNNGYVVFKDKLSDECFNYYLSNNYRVVTLIVE